MLFHLSQSAPKIGRAHVVVNQQVNHLVQFLSGVIDVFEKRPDVIKNPLRTKKSHTVLAHVKPSLTKQVVPKDAILAMGEQHEQDCDATPTV